MHHLLLLVGLVGLGAASSTPHIIDFASVDAAPSPTMTGPPRFAMSHDVIINSASVAAEGSAAVTAVASASVTPSQTSNKKRGWELYGDGEVHGDEDGKAGLGIQWGWPHLALDSPSSTANSWSPSSTSNVWKVTASSSSSSRVATFTNTWTTTTRPDVSSSFVSTLEPTSTISEMPISSTVSSVIGSPTPFEDLDACASQPGGYGPHVEPDTAEAFLSYAEFHNEAQAATAPSGYTETFVDLNASLSANTYLGFNTLQAYDMNLCAEQCNNKVLCTGFNIFFERDPSLKPTDNCPQPPSITNYKCTFWGSGADAAAATNYGSYEEQFHVVITGSDGFEKTVTMTPAKQPGWQAPEQCGKNGSTVYNEPNTSLGTSFFPGPYNPAVCADYAQAYNSKHGESALWSDWFVRWKKSDYSEPCVFFNSYMLKKNGQPKGTYCALYSQSYDGDKANYTPGWQGNDYWSIESSFGWSIKESNED